MYVDLIFTSVPRKHPCIMTNNWVRRWSTGYSPPPLVLMASFSLISTAATTKAGEHGIAGV